MNQIKALRLVGAGFVTLIAYILVETIVERVFGRLLFGGIMERAFDRWYRTIGVYSWDVENIILNLLIAIVMCTIMIWLYAALRPMFGVGTKTALVTCAFLIVIIATHNINGANLGYIPPGVAIVDLVYNAVEMPIALIAGAQFYETG